MHRKNQQWWCPSKALEENSLNIPVSDEPLLFAVVADDAFPLKIYLIKPYPRFKPADV